MKKKGTDYTFTAIGLLLLVAGLFLVKTRSDQQGIMLSLPYICIGLGCGIFGHGMGNIISRRALKNSPAIRKQIEIDKKDERNMAIANRAKAKAYDMMISVFGALILAFALMDIDMSTVLMLVFVYLFVVGYNIYYRCKYNKEM